MRWRVLLSLFTQSLFCAQAFGQYYNVENYLQKEIDQAIGNNKDLKNDFNSRVDLWLSKHNDPSKGSVFNPVERNVLEVYKDSLKGFIENVEQRENSSNFLADVVSPLAKKDIDKLTAYTSMLNQTSRDLQHFYTDSCGHDFNKNKVKCQQAEVVINAAKEDANLLRKVAKEQGYSSLGHVNYGGFFNDVDDSHFAMNQLKDSRLTNALLQNNFKSNLAKIETKKKDALDRAKTSAKAEVSSDKDLSNIWKTCQEDMKKSGFSTSSNVYKSVEVIANNFIKEDDCKQELLPISDDELKNLMNASHAADALLHTSPASKFVEIIPKDVRLAKQKVIDDSQADLATLLAHQINEDSAIHFNKNKKDFAALDSEKLAQELNEQINEFNNMCKGLYGMKKVIDDMYKPGNTANLRPVSRAGQAPAVPNYDLIAQSRLEYKQKIDEFKHGASEELVEREYLKEMEQGLEGYKVETFDNKIIGFSRNENGKLARNINSMEDLWKQALPATGFAIGRGAVAMMQSKFSNLMKSEYMDRLSHSTEFQKMIGFDRLADEEAMMNKCMNGGFAFGKYPEKKFGGINYPTSKENLLSADLIEKAQEDLQSKLTKTHSDTTNVKNHIALNEHPDYMPKVHDYLKETVRDRPLAVIKYIQKTNNSKQSAMLCSYLAEAMDDEQFHHKMQQLMMVGTGAAIGLAIASGGSALVLMGTSLAVAGVDSAIILDHNAELKAMKFKQQLSVASSDLGIIDQINRGEEIDDNVQINTAFLAMNVLLAPIDVGQGFQHIAKNPKFMRNIARVGAKNGKKELTAYQLRTINNLMAKTGDERRVLGLIDECLKKPGKGGFSKCLSGSSDDASRLLAQVKSSADDLAKDEQVMKAIGVKNKDDYYAKLINVATEPEYASVLKNIDNTAMSAVEKAEAKKLVLDIMVVKQAKGKTKSEILKSLDGIFNTCKL